MPRVRSRQAPEVRRAGIMDAATQVFLERGIVSATMEDVARAAGVAKGTVYLYFESKEALVAALQRRFEERLIVRARRLLDAAAGERAEHLDRFLAGMVDELLDYPDLQHMLFHEAPGHGGLDELHGLLASFLERASDELRVSAPDLAARFIVEGVRGVLATAVHEPRPGKPVVRSAVSEACRRVVGRV